MGTGFVTSRSCPADERVSAPTERWLKKAIVSIAVLAVTYFAALFCIAR